MRHFPAYSAPMAPHEASSSGSGGLSSPYLVGLVVNGGQGVTSPAWHHQNNRKATPENQKSFYKTELVSGHPTWASFTRDEKEDGGYSSSFEKENGGYSFEKECGVKGKRLLHVSLETMVVLQLSICL